MSSISKNVLTSIEAVSGDGNNRVRVNFLSFALPSRWFLALLAVPMLIALGISAYLTYVSVTASEIVGCSGGQLFDCSHVIYSKWSKLMSVPVSAMALATYLGMIAAALVTSVSRFSNSTRQMAWVAVTGLAIAAALAALYFTFLQVFVLEHLCPWCLGAHACGLLIATAILCKNRIALPQMATVSGFAAAGLAVMIGLQVNSEEPPKFIITEYEPVVVPNNDAESQVETYVIAPQDFEGAPTDDEKMLAPDDDMLFAPPEDGDEDLFEPPSEDTDDGAIKATEADTALIRAARFSSEIFCQLIAYRFPFQAMLVLQQPAKQEVKQGDAQNSKASSQKTEGKQKALKKEKPKQRIVEFMGKKINAYQWPIDGSPTAKHVFVEMFDYTCPHCRTTSRAIFQVKAEMGDDLAVVVLPVPMHTRCNSAVTQDHEVHREACQLSELAVAVWRCDKAKFSAFHKWMFEGDKAPNHLTALSKAAELVGKEQIETELSKNTSKAYVKYHVQLYKDLQGGAVPKLLFPRRAVQGEFTDKDALSNLIKQDAK